MTRSFLPLKTLLGFGLLALLATGCRSTEGYLATRTYDMPPAALEHKVKTALTDFGFEFTQDDDGTIETSWRTYPGEWYGFLLRRKLWHEQDKFLIRISPLETNVQQSELRVQTLAEERRNETDPWQTKQFSEYPMAEGKSSHLIDAFDTRINGESGHAPPSGGTGAGGYH